MFDFRFVVCITYDFFVVGGFAARFFPVLCLSIREVVDYEPMREQESLPEPTWISQTQLGVIFKRTTDYYSITLV